MPPIAEISFPHHQIYENLYKELNPRNKETVAANEAALFLKRSNLSVSLLGQIWEIADHSKNGFLTKEGAFIAFKLVAACQQNLPIHESSLTLPLAAPVFDSRSATPSIPNISGLSVSSSWGISASDQSKYEAIFDSLNPVDGKVPGDKVRPVLLNSGLPSVSLAKIWELSDIDKDGQLDKVEMCIALHLVYCILQGEPVPISLPPSLIHWSKKTVTSPSTYVNNPPIFARHRSRASSTASLEGAGITNRKLSMSEVGMRPHSVQPHSVTSSSPPLCASLATSTQEWPVQVSKYESEFKKADTNKDGLVSGIDVREYLIASTVPQTVLAQLWSLVDFRKNGMLNIEQFALIMHLIDEWKSGIPAPSVLPPFLIPPQFRSIGASSTSLSLQADSSSLSSGNEELDMVQNEIQDLILERRQIDLDIVQLEADLTIKNSEIKNLEIELSTLENTVLQLERQKSEANRRLGLLDEQIEQLERNSVNLKEKLCEEQQRVNRLRKEAEDKENNASVVNDQLTAAKSELAAVEEENRKTKAELSQGKAEVEKISVQLTNLERDISNVENKKMNVEKEAEKSSKISSRLSELLEAKDIETIIMEQAELLGTKTLVSQNKSVSGAVLKTSMASDPFKETSATASDPFGSDPFAGTNSSFAAFDDQFGGRFNANPFDDSSSPFSMTGTAESSATPRSASVPIGSSKLPPPRPAPPKTVQSFSALNEPDPFSSSEATEKSGSAPGCQGGFADFSAAFS